MKKKESDLLWDEIKDLSIEMFSLPNQRIKDHVTRKAGTQENIIVTLNSSAALPALETVLNMQKQYKEKVSYAMKAEGENVTEAFPKYEMEETRDGFVIIKRYIPKTDKPEFQNYQKNNITKENGAVLVTDQNKPKEPDETTRNQSPRTRAKIRKSLRDSK